ncbi:hypothetical protein OCU04_001954 [Sclerotinia nivalis]|uniref:Uncharacterized protein n=1 Tax=Sclerotinia nivalis TaxID=352851 RepID=A0A9X0AZU3_9HELO|nr:hypothetical protein OCU04_001954 [Sclerotinia nivalis]
MKVQGDGSVRPIGLIVCGDGKLRDKLWRNFDIHDASDCFELMTDDMPVLVKEDAKENNEILQHQIERLEGVQKGG